MVWLAFFIIHNQYSNTVEFIDIEFEEKQNKNKKKFNKSQNFSIVSIVLDLFILCPLTDN